MPATPRLTKPQAGFLALECAFPLFVGGFGSGKTWAGCSKLCASAWTDPKVPLGYFAPTQPDVKQIFFPTLEECAADWGLNTKERRGDLEVDLFSGRTYRTTIICRSMKVPGSIKGFKIGRGLADEIDTLPLDHATDAWRKIIARRRFKFEGNGWIGVTTTPEGFQFCHGQWVKQVRDNPELASKYQMIRASTRSNAKHLQDDYIDTLLATYPANLVEAYIDGLFVNLRSGTVYREYDRKLNRSSETIKPKEPVHIGMDFNVGKMAAVVHIYRKQDPHAVDEIMSRIDTPDMINEIKSRYWTFDGNDYKRDREIWIYPDASGASRKTVQASTSDIQLLRDAGFRVSAPKANPPVRDRINAMNAAFCNAKGERHYFVNDEACPTYAETLEQQPYNAQGEPEKTHDQDHPNDASGYFINRKHPVTKPVRAVNLRVAM